MSIGTSNTWIMISYSNHRLKQIIIKQHRLSTEQCWNEYSNSLSRILVFIFVFGPFSISEYYSNICRVKMHWFMWIIRIYLNYLNILSYSQLFVFLFVQTCDTNNIRIRVKNTIRFNTDTRSGQGYNPGTSQGHNSGHQGDFSPVAFTAMKAAYCCTRRGRLVLEKTITNLGGGWNGRAGEFEAPSSGSYVFSWSALSTERENLQLGLMRNGLELASSWADRSGYQTASGSVVLTLRRGDTVHLTVLDGEVHEPRSSDRGYSSFSGYRIG